MAESIAYAGEAIITGGAGTAREQCALPHISRRFLFRRLQKKLASNAQPSPHPLFAGSGLKKSIQKSGPRVPLTGQFRGDRKEVSSYKSTLIESPPLRCNATGQMPSSF
ncbi:hypothetical protein OKW49_003448 [Paraburkholderia youngii]|uniref:hypothetical protein n=1 Tax=Paraburkholderia youngii TaxID=2782701 RepID=UPI003D1D9F6D